MTKDERFVTQLKNFTDALGEITKILQEDNNKKNVDTVEGMLSNMSSDIAGIVKNLELVVKSTERIEANTNKILDELKEIKKSKSKGSFETVSETENKKKIIDAVKVVILIAAGILAMGLALKMISPVSFLSVIAIGLAIVFVSTAFVMVASLTEGMSVGETAKISTMMVIMAMGLAVSSWALATAATITAAKMASIVFAAIALGTSLVLMSIAVHEAKIKPADFGKFMLLTAILPLIALGIMISSIILAGVRPLTFAQMASTVFMAVAIGASLIAISMALDKAKMGRKEMSQIMWLPVLVPALAIGLVIASLILALIYPLGFMQMVTAVFVAITIGVLVYLLKPILNKMDEIDPGQLANFAVLVPILAGGIVVASWIFAMIKPMGFMQSLLVIMTSLAIGLAVLFITPAILLLKSIDKKDMEKAAMNVIIAAGAIAVSSILLSLGSYDNAPDWQWAIGAGLAITAFAGTIWLIRKMNLNKAAMMEGALTILGISAVIALTSFILALGNYDKHPSLGWALGVGLSLVAFGGAMMLLGIIISSSGGAAAGAMALGALATLMVAGIVVAVSWLLAVGNYTKYPGLDWALGVGLTLVAFGTTMAVLGLMIVLIAIGAGSMAIIASTISATSRELATGDYMNGPSEDWAKAVSALLYEFSWTMIRTAFIPNKLLERCALGLMIIAQNIVDVSNVLATGNYNVVIDKNWAESTAMLIGSFAMASIAIGLNPFVLLGMLGMMAVANSIVEVSNILAGGNYTGGPDEKWARGVGLSIKAFAEGISAMQKTDSIWSFFGGKEDQGKKIEDIARSMLIANEILREGVWTEGSYPSPAWAKGVGGAIKAFAEGISAMQSTGFLGGLFGGGNYNKKIESLARAMMKAADILGEYDWKSANNYPTPEWSTGVGNAINAFAKPLAELAKYDVTGSDITDGIYHLVTSMVKTALTFTLANKLFGGNIWAAYPDPKWSTAVGTAIGTFVKYLVEIEKNDVGRGDVKNLNRTIDSMINTALRFTFWSKLGDIWAAYPSKEWSTAVGEAIGTFVKYLVEIEKKDIGRGDIKNLNRTIDAMVDTALRFTFWSMFDIWDSYPSKEWSKGVGDAIGTFVKYLVDIEKYDIGRGDIRNLNRIIDSMVSTAIEFTMFGNIWSSYPKPEWSDAVMKSIETFTQSIKMLSDVDEGDYNLLSGAASSMINFAVKISTLNRFKNLFEKDGIIDLFSASMKKLVESLPTQEAVSGLKTLSEALNSISTMGITSSSSIYALSRAMLTLGESLKTLDLESLDKLSKFSHGILVLSLIDDKKLEETLKLLEAKKNDIKSILSDNAKETRSAPVTAVETTTATPSAGEDFYKSLLDAVSRIDVNVDKIAKKEPPELSQNDTTDTDGGSSEAQPPGKVTDAATK
jgi:hypothetical protein